MQNTANQTKLARELGVTTRRARQLEELGVIIANLEGGYELSKNLARYGVYSRRAQADIDALDDDILQAAKDAEAGIAKADPKASDFEKVARRASEAVTALDEAMRLRNAMMPEGKRDFLDSFREMLIGRAQGFLLSAAMEFYGENLTTARGSD